MNLSDRFRSLAADMAEAERRANTKGTDRFEELESILVEYESRLNAPTPNRYQAPLPPPANTYDLEHARALQGRGLSS